jgi:hypothetical protein
MMCVWRLVLLALVIMAALQISCGSTPSSTTTNPDPPKGKITKIDAPSILCYTKLAIKRDTKSAAPISVAVVINPNLTVPQYCSVGIFEDWYMEIGDQVACESKPFTASGTIVFNDFNLADGRYIVIAGLSDLATCHPWLNYDTTAWHYLAVGGDSCATWRTFAFDYYRQGHLEAFPKGLSYVQQSYDAGRISLSMYTVADTLPFERITIHDPNHPEDDVLDYMVNHVNTSLGFGDHLFAIRGLQYASGQVLAAYGITAYNDNGDEPTVICVTRIVANFYSPDSLEAVSSTSIHELGHLIGRLTDACQEAPDSHVVGQCVMEDIAYYNGLKLYCDSPDQYWPYTNTFCDSCVRRLEALTW